MMPLPCPRPCSTATTLGAELSTKLSSSSENSLKRDISGPRTRGDRKLLGAPRAQQAERHGALCAFFQNRLQIGDALDALAIQREQHVTEQNARAFCGAAFLHAGHHEAHALSGTLGQGL